MIERFYHSYKEILTCTFQLDGVRPDPEPVKMKSRQYIERAARFIIFNEWKTLAVTPLICSEKYEKLSGAIR